MNFINYKGDSKLSINYLFEDSGLLECDDVLLSCCSDEVGKWRMCE